MEVNQEIANISASIKEIGNKLDSEYLSKAQYKLEAQKLADAVSALSKEMDSKRLAEKSHPLFGDMKTAHSFIDCLKGAMSTSDFEPARKVTAEKGSGFYVNKADLNSYGTGTGVETVPTAVSDVFSFLLSQGGVARRNATVIGALQGNVTLTKRNGTSTAAFTEAASVNKDDTAPTPVAFGTSGLTLSPKQIAAFSLVSDKLLYASAINVAEMVATDLIEQASILEDNCVIRGDGSSTYGGSTGLNTQSGVGEKTVEVSEFIDLSGFLDLPGEVHESVYDSPNAAYYISGKMLQIIRGFRNTANYYLDPTTGKFNLGGYPINVWHRLDNTVATGKFVAYFGDMRKAVTVGIGRDMAIEVSRDYKFGTNQTAFRLAYDYHSVNIQASAMARLKIVADAT